MTPPESTEPRTAAQMSGQYLVSEFVRLSLIAENDPSHYAQADDLRAELLRRLATITPTEPGRVVIEREPLERILYFFWTGGHLSHGTLRELLDAIDTAITAAEHAATGGA